MNFLNSILSGAHLLMYNLNQRQNVPGGSNLFHPNNQSAMNKPASLNQPREQNKIPINPKVDENTAQSMILSQIIISQQQNLINQLLLNPQSQQQTFIPNETAFIQQQPQQFNQQIIPQHQTKFEAQQQPQDRQQQFFGHFQQMDEQPSETINPRNSGQDDIGDQYDSQSKFDRQARGILRKRIKKENTCGHADKEHYAKGMCSNCYHKFGRNKKPWQCPHDKLYAQGLCQNCYINKYNHRKRVENTSDNFNPDNTQEFQDQQNQSIILKQENQQTEYNTQQLPPQQKEQPLPQTQPKQFPIIPIPQKRTIQEDEDQTKL